MFELQYITGAVLFLTEFAKRRLKRKFPRLDPAVPVLIALSLGALLNLLNAAIFGGVFDLVVAQNAIKEGLIAAGLAMGTWSAGKATMEGVASAKAATRRAA